MDELNAMRSFRAERVKRSPEARATAWQALEDRFESAPATPAPSAAPVRRRAFLPWRHRLVAFAGGAATVAAVAGAILVLGSGPRAEPAVAQVLRQTAAVAAAADGPSGIPGPGEFLYTRTKSLELQGWLSGSSYTIGGGLLGEKGAFNALVPWREEAWNSVEEADRHRSVIGIPRFFSSAERSRWEKAGSPLPVFFGSRGVTDYEAEGGSGFRDFSKLPTEPEALRRAIERRPLPRGNDGPLDIDRHDTGRVIAELWEILDKPNGTPALRAAVFGALAELPGIELDRDAANLVGRPGYALSYEATEPSIYAEQQPGIRVDYIFDPKTSEILGKREVFADPRKLRDEEGVPSLRGLPPGTVRREVAYPQSAIVHSTHERPGGNRTPVATTSRTLK